MHVIRRPSPPALTADDCCGFVVRLSGVQKLLIAVVGLQISRFEDAVQANPVRVAVDRDVAVNLPSRRNTIAGKQSQLKFLGPCTPHLPLCR